MCGLKGFYFALIMLAFSFLGNAQDGSHRGMIILRDGDTLTENFTFDLQNDLLQVSVGGTIKAYGARQVSEFNYFDSNGKPAVYFFSLPFSEYSDYKVPTFFELVYNGTALSLLSREALVTISVPQYDPFTHRTTISQQQRLIVELYFRTPNGKITHYKYRKKQLFAIMRDREDEVRKFYKEKNLGHTEKYDIIKLVEYYNSLNPPFIPKLNEN